MKDKFTFVKSAMFLITAVAAHAGSSTIFVGSCGTPSAPTIQAAVNSSSPGGTVQICPGTYHEQVTITKNLTVNGFSNSQQAIITSPAGGVVANSTDPASSSPVAAQILAQNANVSLNNVIVDGSGNQIGGCALDIRGIYYLDASGEITNVATRNQTLAVGLTGCQSGQGIFVQSGYGSSAKQNVQIQNNSVRAFQKNGITVDGNTLSFTVSGNYIVGQGPTTGAAENGIQVSDGAQGKVSNNTTIDEIWAPDTAADSGDAASGIIIVGSQNVEIANNTVGSTQFGIGTFTYSFFGTPGNPLGLADHTSIHDNNLLGTQIFDAIDVCSSNNMVQNNTIFSSTESAIHLDSSCSESGSNTGENNHLTNNTINEACAGILEGATPNKIDPSNSFFNVGAQILFSNVCPAPPGTPTATAGPNGNAEHGDAFAQIRRTGPVLTQGHSSSHRPSPVR